MDPIIGLVAIAGIAVVIYMEWRRSKGAVNGNDERLIAELDRKNEEVGEIKAKLDAAISEKDELSGKGKLLYDNFKNLESELKILRQERDNLQEIVQEFKANDKRREKEFETRLEKLEAAKQSLEQERQRVVREDEDRRQQELEERDRLWADHENTVVATLTDLCKQPQFSFTSYTNTSLPEGFDGSLKPDFMIEFLDQYIIFDAKVSKAKSLQTYVNDQVKKTVEKVKDNERIYKTIFLVVPTSAINELKSHHYVSDGYNLYVISPEALPPILASLKRITMYEFAEQMDPMQRENIVQMIAELDFHINLRNAADIILSKMGTDLLQKAQRIDPAISEEVALKKQPMNMKAALAASEIKKIVSNLTAQNEEIQRLVSPSAPVLKKDLKEAEEILEQSFL